MLLSLLMLIPIPVFYAIAYILPSSDLIAFPSSIYTSMHSAIGYLKALNSFIPISDFFLAVKILIWWEVTRLFLKFVFWLLSMIPFFRNLGIGFAPPSSPMSSNASTPNSGVNG